MTTRRRVLAQAAMAGTASLLPPLVNAAAPAVSGQPGRWSSAASLPYAVQEIYPARFERAGQVHLVVAGGFRRHGSAGLAPTREVVAWSPAGNRWAQWAALPKARHHPVLQSFDGCLYAIGGFESAPRAAWLMQAGVWSLASDGNEWLAAPALPAPQAEVVAAVLGDALFVTGGLVLRGAENGERRHTRSTTLTLALEAGTSSWRGVAPALTRRASATGGVIDGKLYVAGGRSVDGRGRLTNSAALECYDPDADRWATLAPMPQAQGGLAGAVLEGKLYVFGGEQFAPPKVYPEVWAYDPKHDRWEAAAAMPTPRHGLGAVTLDRWHPRDWRCGAARG